MPIEEVINMFKKAGVVSGSDGKPSNAPLKIEVLIASIEKYYSPDQHLEVKYANEEAFKAFLAANPALNPHAQAPKPAEGEESSETPEEQEQREIKSAEEQAAAR